MGSANPRAFSRNQRGIAGSRVWINFDRHALRALINDQGGTFVPNMDEIRPQYSISDGTFIGQSTIFNANITNPMGIPTGTTLDAQQALNVPISNVLQDTALATPWASDQILPFDVTLAGTNEYGAAATMKIFGVEILNEGWGTSVDDTVNEMQSTFIARLVCTRDTRFRAFRALNQVPLPTCTPLSPTHFATV
jgi:hypothetical protein